MPPTFLNGQLSQGRFSRNISVLPTRRRASQLSLAVQPSNLKGNAHDTEDVDPEGHEVDVGIDPQKREIGAGHFASRRGIAVATAMPMVKHTRPMAQPGSSLRF